MNLQMDEIQLKKELEQFDNDRIISIVKNVEEEDIIRLQLAWEILQERGIKDNILREFEQLINKQKISIEELLNDEENNSADFSDKVKENVAKEIFINNRDIIGVIKNPTAFEGELLKRMITTEERNILVRKAKIKLIVSGISFSIALLLFATNLSFNGKIIFEWALVGHSFLKIFQAISIYRIEKNN